MDEYDIYIRGFVGPRAAVAESGLVRMFGLDARRARELVQSLPRVVKRHVPAAHATHYERVLQELGADYELRRSPIRPQRTIAVASSVDSGAPEIEQHGSTLTLSLAVPNVDQHADVAPAARQPRFAATVVDNRTPYGPPQPVVAPASAPAAHGAEPSAAKATLREPIPGSPAEPPSHSGTWREGDPALIDPPPLAMAAPARAPTPAAAPASVPSVPARAPTPAPAPPANHAWTGFAIADAPTPSARPASRQPPELDITGRPDWLVQGPRLYQEPEALSAPAGAAPQLDAGGGARAPSARPSAAVMRGQPEPSAVGSPALAPGHNVGVHLRHELADDDEPPALLRFALRVGLGLSLFVILATVRQCRAIDSDVHDALAQWGVQPASEIAAPEADQVAVGPVEYGPRALPWLESELHQVSNGDKDRVRSMVKRYKRAGATEVYMANIMRSGLVQIAGELIIELPSDEQARAVVIAEHERVLAASFGGFAPEGADPGGPVLRMTL